MGGRKFFFLSCFLNCFKLQMFKRITSPTSDRNHCNEITVGRLGFCPHSH